MSFNLLAPHYRWMEFVLAGKKLQRCRTAFLDRIRDHKNILILGEGTGRFLCELARVNRFARITCVDGSNQMLRQAKKRLTQRQLIQEKIEFLQRDILDWIPPRAQFDAIVSHFFLDCFTLEQLDPMITRITASAQPKAIWLLADFYEPSIGLARWRAMAILWLMYRFFRLTTRLAAASLAAPDLLLQKNGFVLRERRFADWKLLHSDLWQNELA